MAHIIKWSFINIPVKQIILVPCRNRDLTGLLRLTGSFINIPVKQKRTCNGFVLQMAHFYSKKIDFNEIPPKYHQMIPKCL